MLEASNVRAHSVLEPILKPGRHGSGYGAPGLWVRERTGIMVATIISRRGQAMALASAVRSQFNCTLPPGPEYVRRGPVAFIGIGRGKWLAINDRPALAAIAFTVLQSSAAISDQSSGYALVDIGGTRAPDALAKGCNVDLHPAVFKVGSVAATGMFYTAIILWQIDPKPLYQIAIPRSWAPSFMEAFLAGATEFEVEIRPSVEAGDLSETAN
ncbi:MAG: hypothetical protein KGJ66_15410 [Alphaproteobacteria bacterium]|nr:hypothetical protein [Alphaproteobacteria bacterium]